MILVVGPRPGKGETDQALDADGPAMSHELPTDEGRPKRASEVVSARSDLSGFGLRSLQIRDDVVDVVVSQRDRSAQCRRTNRVLAFLREVEEPLIVSDGVAECLRAVVVEVAERCPLDAPGCRNSSAPD